MGRAIRAFSSSLWVRRSGYFSVLPYADVLRPRRLAGCAALQQQQQTGCRRGPDMLDYPGAPLALVSNANFVMGQCVRRMARLERLGRLAGLGRLVGLERLEVSGDLKGSSGLQPFTIAPVSALLGTPLRSSRSSPSSRSSRSKKKLRTPKGIRSFE